MKDTFNLLRLAAVFFLIYGSIWCSLLVGRITVALSVMLANKQGEGAKRSLAYSDVLRGLPVRLIIIFIIYGKWVPEATGGCTCLCFQMSV